MTENLLASSPTVPTNDGGHAVALTAAQRRHDRTGTQRSREYRRRKKEGLRPIALEIRETEIDLMIEKRLLKHEERSDGFAIQAALYRFFDMAFSALQRGDLHSESNAGPADV